MSFAARLGVGLAATVLLMLPALWNGFPLLQYDTGGYLARWHEGTLELSRAVLYGLLLTAGARWDFWPVVVVQAALTVWVLALVLRTHGLGGRPLLLLGITAFLAIVTTLPWLTSILLTDIFAGLGVLALYLLILRSDALHRTEIIGLVILVAVAATTHGATFALLLALLLAGLAVRLVKRHLIPLAGLGRGAIAIILGIAVTLTANFAVTKRLAWTPGGVSLLFGRMLQDGIVDRYLADHCPDPRFTLCAYRGALPNDADLWFWGSDLFDRLGRFAGLGREMQTIVLESIAAYPWLQLKSAAAAVGRQLMSVGTGEGVVDSIWHTYAIITRDAPGAVPAMRAARQQQGGFDFTVINRLHVPVALASMLLLIAIVAASVRGRRNADLRTLAAAILLAILANAAICGVLANPHDRYGARVAWVAVLVVAMAGARMLATSTEAGAAITRRR